MAQTGASGTLPRVTYTNIGEDFSGVHALLDRVIPETETRLLGKRWHNVVAGKKLGGGQIYTAASPIDRDLVLGEFFTATPSEIESAVAAASKASAAWQALGWERRVAILRAGANELDRRKYEISAACLIEVGKSRLEAVGEVEEAVDLIRFYADEMERNDGFLRPTALTSPAELTRSVLRPVGVFAVIAPFNFPVALALGMSSAALIAGNAVVLKPSPMSGLTGALLAECLVAGGVPEGVLNLVFGGGEVGDALVRNPDVDGIAFTGSNAVGMAILRIAASGRANRPVLAEMGGKNPSFVTAAADLDVAASGVMRSAFGMQGQKCSAGSKVYVAATVYDALLDKLTALTQAIKIGDPRRTEIYMGPVINEAALKRFDDASAAARATGRCVHGGARLRDGAFGKGHFVAPTIVDGLPGDHPINREELFLPFLSVLRFDSLDQAIADANAAEYGLTAGIYTKNQDELDRFLTTIEAGVLYANRASGATTGAWPGLQTFCGWKGSGTTGKGGLGSWYLPQFMREQSHTLYQR